MLETSMSVPSKELERVSGIPPGERVGDGSIHQHFQVTGDQEGLSQVMAEDPSIAFCQENLGFQSQVSADGSQTHPIDHHPPTHGVLPKAIEHPSGSEEYDRYDTDVIDRHTPTSVFTDTQQPGHSTLDSTSHQKLDSPASILARESRFTFHESPSMEQLSFSSQLQRPGAGRGGQELPPLNQANLALAQRQFGMSYPVALSQQDLFHTSNYSGQPQHEFFADPSASQPTDWNAPSRMWDMQRRPQFDMWGAPHSHGQFPPGRGPADKLDKGPGMMGMEYMGYRPQSQFEHPEMARRRRVSSTDYNDYYKYNQHPGYRVNPHPPRWNMPLDEEKVNPSYHHGRMSFRGHEEDASFEYLSQPSSLPPGRYSGYHPSVGMPGGGRVGNVPSGYSLSQSSGSMYMRQPSKDGKRKSVLKNRNEQSPRGDLGW